MLQLLFYGYLKKRKTYVFFYEAVSGARLHAAYYRIGGVHQDIPKKVLEDIFNWSKKFGKVIEDIEGLLDNNRIFKQRTVNVGVVSANKL